jgi:hypothetical protein
LSLNSALPYLCDVKKESIFIFGVLFLLFCSFVGQNQKVYAYLFDNANFTEKHCVNKDDITKKCNGVCQLIQVEEEEPTAPNQPEYRSLDLFLTEGFTFILLFNQTLTEKMNDLHAYRLLKKKEKLLVPPPNSKV